MRVGNWTRLADKPELVAARAMLDELLLPHQPEAPIDGPVRLWLEFTWPWLASDSKRTRALGRIPHTSKPDCDNAAKAITDRLSALCFMGHDANVVDLRVQKWRGEHAGIDVRVEAWMPIAGTTLAAGETSHPLGQSGITGHPNAAQRGAQAEGCDGQAYQAPQWPTGQVVEGGRARPLA